MKLDRTSSRPLADQMFDQLRNAIATGRYAPGDVLPSLDALAAETGVSVNVPRRALTRLAEAGLVVPRRGVGSCVTNRRTDATCRGRVLCCGPFGGSSAYFDNLALALRQRLFAKGYLLELGFSAPGKTDVSAENRRSRFEDSRRPSGLLPSMLKLDWDLVLFWDDPRLRQLVRTTHARFVTLGDSPGGADDPNCMGTVSIKNGKGLPEFIRACVRKGIRRSVQFRFASDQVDAAASFEIAGIRTETICLPHPKDAESCTRAGLKAVQSFLKRTRQKPAVIYFADDHLAQGGLLALSQAGLRIPEDVGVVTLSNRGIGPVWTKPLTRLETDPIAHGHAIADAVLSYFKNGRFPVAPELGSTWKTGTTFQV